MKDYFDRLVYATAGLNRAILLTQDRTLIHIGKQTAKESANATIEKVMDHAELNEKTIRPLDIVSWSEFLRRFET